MSPAERKRWPGRLRLVAVYGLIVTMVVLSRPNPVAVTAGSFVALLGEAIRFWAAGHLHKTVELITAGPYRYTRNPLYLGRLLVFSGLCVMATLPYMANLVILAAGWAVFFGYYLPRKERVEPSRLREVHGAVYERYFEAVPALWPARAPYPVPDRKGWSSERLVRNREHWMLAGLLAMILLLLWKAYR